jgi:hypothetical protein
MSAASYTVFAARRLNLSGAAAGIMNPPQVLTVLGALIRAFLLDPQLGRVNPMRHLLCRIHDS